jgi:hypothetical protein
MGTTARTITAYVLVDTAAGRVLATYTVEQRQRGRNRADKMDQAYGAHRYACRPVYSDTPMGTVAAHHA